MNVILGVDIWSSIFWVGFLFHGFYCPLWILGPCGGCGSPSRECFEALPGMALVGPGLNLFLGIGG